MIPVDTNIIIVVVVCTGEDTGLLSMCHRGDTVVDLTYRPEFSGRDIYKLYIYLGCGGGVTCVLLL